MAQVVELQLQKLQKKLSHFEAMDIGLETDRINLERERNSLLAQWAELQDQKPGVSLAELPIVM